MGHTYLNAGRNIHFCGRNDKEIRNSWWYDSQIKEKKSHEFL